MACHSVAAPVRDGLGSVTLGTYPLDIAKRIAATCRQRDDMIYLSTDTSAAAAARQTVRQLTRARRRPPVSVCPVAVSA